MTDKESGEFETCPYADAIEMMLAYHLRVREQLARLRAIDLDAQDGEPDALEEAARLAASALDLFGREGELHAFDEDGLLFPRLREALGSSESAVTDALDAVEEEHVVLRPLWPPLAWHLNKLSVPPDEPVSLRDLHEARLALAGCVLPHMQFEERYVYPAARRILGAEELRRMVGEMREHRRSPTSVRPFAALA